MKPGARRSRSRGWPVWMICLIAAVVSCAFTFGELRRPAPAMEEGQVLLTSTFEPPATSAEVLLARGDGQLFASHAIDPLLRHPERFRGGPNEQAYRFQRPMFGWIGWVASLGQPSAVPWVMLALTIASVVALVGVLASFIEARGGDARLALCAFVTPGVIADLVRVGPEALATALALLGVGAWIGIGRRRSRVLAIALLSVAMLCRETIVLVPIGLALYELRPSARDWRAAFTLSVTVVPYALWVAVVRLHLGAWPVRPDDGNYTMTFVPYAGLVEAVPLWSSQDVIFIGSLLVGAVLAIATTREMWVRVCMLTFVPAGALIGYGVWKSWLDIGRPLLPLSVFSILALSEFSRAKSSPSLR